ADENQDGKMSYEEVQTLLQMINIDLSEQYARNLFTVGTHTHTYARTHTPTHTHTHTTTNTTNKTTTNTTHTHTHTHTQININIYTKHIPNIPCAHTHTHAYKQTHTQITLCISQLLTCLDESSVMEPSDPEAEL